MEKYRKFGDAATGVNPFVFTHKPSLLSTGLAIALVPFRLVLAVLLALLLFVVDMMLHTARNFLLAGLLTPYLLFPLQSILGQLFLLAVANLRVRQRIFPRSSPTGLAGPTVPGPGDVVVTNMQSPLDTFVLLAAGGLAAWRVPYCTVVYFCHNSPHIVQFGPNPFQRWKALFHVLYSATRKYLAMATVDTETITVDLTAVQRQAQKLGVPVVFFAEGTTTNGRGILQFPNVKLVGSRVFLVSLRYTSPAVNAVIDHMQYGSIFFSWASLVGSADSPMFPEALVTVHKEPQALTTDGDGGTATADANNGGAAPLVMGRAALQDVRERLAHGVSYGNRNVVCVPVQLQGRNKHEFAVYFHQFGNGAAS